MSDNLPVLEKISYSSLLDNKLCGFYFKLKHILKLEADTNTVWTHYGKWVHHYIQEVLEEKLEPDIAAKKFIRSWFKFCGIFKKQLKEQLSEDPVPLYKGPVRAIMTVQEFFKKEFGNYKILHIEEKLEELTKYPQKFKGFIDIVLESEDGFIYIIDLKTCRNHYLFAKYSDKFKEYQLTLYKHFWCTKHKVDPKKVKTCFITLARDPTVKKPLNIIQVTSGTKKVNNALDWMNGVLSAIEREMFVKNRMTCRNMFNKTCPFFQTTHCT